MRNAIVLLALGLATSAHAEDRAALQLVVQGAIDTESLRSRVAAELGLDVALVDGACDTPCVDVAIDRNRTAKLRFTPRTGASRERTVTLGDDPRQWPLVITLLAGNVVRDEAADLLALLPSREPPSPPDAAAIVDGGRPSSRPPLAPAPEPRGRHERIPAATITVSPLAMISPIAYVSAELHLAGNIGVAGIGALGRAKSCGPDAGYIEAQLGACTGPSGTSFGLGGQFNYYFMHPFAGVHAGLEVMYGHTRYSGTDSADVAYALEDTSFRAGPYLGYKLIAGAGFTLLAQVGAVYANTTSKVESMNGAVSTANPSMQHGALASLVKLQLGWTF